MCSSATLVSSTDSIRLPPWQWDMSSLSNKSFPSFSRPAEVGHLSIVKKGHSSNGHQNSIYADDRSLSVWSPVSLQQIKSRQVDLNAGYNSWNPGAIKSSDDPTLLEWLHMTKHNLQDVEFVCWRGLLTYLASTPYEMRDEWLVAAIKCQNVIFLYRFESDAQINQRQQQMDDEKQRRFLYWGYSFEKYMTSYESKATDLSVKDDSFVSVVECKLGGMKLLFGGEVDCIDLTTQRETGDGQSVPRKYVELKTSRFMSTRNQDTSFRRFKLMKWWLQSFLVGIDTIVAGFRDDAGFVVDVKDYPVAGMHRMAREFWTPSVCINFLHDFLAHVKTVMANISEDEVVLFKWHPSRNRNQVHCEKFFKDSKYYFLPDYLRQTYGNG